MALKYKITELFRGKFVNPQNLYSQLEDLDRKIQSGADAVPITREKVKLTKSALKKEFGDPKKFKNIAIVHNDEGSYLIVAKDKEFMYLPLENI